MSSDFNRRKFLKFAAGGLAGAAASGASLTGIGKVKSELDNELVRVPGGKESWALGVCTACPGGCGLRVRKIGNRAVKIQGNPLHPVNRGRLCPKGLAALQELYHPDRLRQPQRNVGSRMAPQWKQVSWDEALGAINKQLQTARDNRGAVAVLDRRPNLLESPLLRQFASAYPGGAYFAMPSGLDGTQSALRFQQGVSDPVAFDFGNSRYVLNFGVNLLEGWGAPVGIMRAFARWRTTESGHRTKLVQIEPRFSVTAGRADEWVSIRPGTEASLALGIAYALISEGLYDSDFVRDHTFGFDDWRDAEGNLHSGFRTLVMNEYRLNDVAAITRVPAEVILRIAREAAQNRPTIAMGPSQTSILSGDTYSSMAVHSLNALLGSIDVPGGVLVQQSIPQAAHSAGATALSGSGIANALDLPKLAASKPGISALIINQANPILTLPNGGDFRDSLAKVPLVVSMTAFMDDTAAMADYILPITSTLESWQGGGSPPTVANAVFSLTAPSVKPRANARHAGDIVLTLAQSASAGIGYSSFDDYLKARTKAIFAAQSGAVFGSNLEDTWNRLLERSGWWSPTYSTADELWEQILQQGGWWEPAYSFGESNRVFRTASGKFEFYSQALRTFASDSARIPEAADRACLPHQPALPETTSNFPVLLLPIETLPLSSGNGAHLPYLQQIAGEHLFANWDSWLEIHPDTARESGIAEGDVVWIESRRGRVQAKARIYEGARPGVVHLPLGYGSRAGSPWACRGADALSIGDLILDPVTQRPVNGGTCVKVYKA